MAVQLSVKAQALIKEISIKPNIILDIEGLDLIFGAMPIFKTLNWDDDNAFWDNGLNWDGVINDTKSRDYISLTGTTTNVSQQIAPDKGNTSSITTANIAIVDKDGEVSRAVSFESIDEILGRKATLALGFAQGAYPEDANKIITGVIVDFYTDSGNVMLSIASSQSLQRQLYLEKWQSDTTALMDISQTTVNLLDTTGLYESQDALTTYIRIDDEIMRVDSIDSNTQLTVTRAQLNTVASTHDLTEAESFYRLQGKPLDLALKVMLSKEGNQYFESLDTPKSINFVSATESIENAVIFDYFNIQDKTGLTVGDFIQLDSTLNTGTYTIDGFGTLNNGGSYILVEETLLDETDYTDNFKYISKYNTLSTGLGMLNNEVDVEQFESIKSAFSSSFVDYDLYVKDSIDDAQADLINKQLFFPQGLYPIVRKAKTSVKFVVPPFSSDVIETINTNNITNINKIKQRRSAHKYLYNTYVYRYNIDSLEDKYLTGKVTVSASSVNRINLGKKQLRVESDGLRNNPETTLVRDNIIRRYVDRYQFAPVYYEGVEVNYKTGYALEIGDIVPFGGKDIKQTNLSSGERGSEAKLYEIINKSLNVKTGSVSLTLLETSFEIQARYGVFSLASNINTGSTAVRIILNKTLDTGEYINESDKWSIFAGNRVRVRSIDYVDDEIVTLVGVDPSNKNALLLETPLSFTPTNNHVIEVPEYDDSDSSIDDDYKLRFCYMTAQAVITSVTDNKTFEVDDISKMVAGSKVYVHSIDYQRDSIEQSIEIDEINGNEITLNIDLDFTPQIGDLVDRSKFQDDGNPYLII
jgi:hypothetical protein